MLHKKSQPIKFLLILLVLTISITQVFAFRLAPRLLGTRQMDSTSSPYWFQVGAANGNGYGSGFGIPVTGASVQIRILSNQILQHPDEELAYWVGVDLPNDAFIQVGYMIFGADNGGAPSQFWEYFPPGTANENLGGFQGRVESVLVGSNGTWVTFSLESLDTRWFAYVNNQTIGTADLQSQETGTGPYAVAEVSGVQETDSILGPVEFRDLSYRDTNLVWHQTEAGVALCCYGATSNSLPLTTPYPYGVESVPGDDNHWVAGSNLPKVDQGQPLWPFVISISERDLRFSTLIFTP